MNTLIFQIDKMSNIEIINFSSGDIHVTVTTSGSDSGKGGSENWYPLKANGGRDSWGYRNSPQLIRIVRSLTAGAPVETYLAIPGNTVYIREAKNS